jgi:hypothetical protein
MGRRDGALMRSAQPSFEQGYDQMDMFEFLKRNGIARADDMRPMPISEGFKFVVDRQSVGYDGRSRFDVVCGKRSHSILANRIDAPEAHATEFLFGLSFNGNQDQRLALGAASSRAFLLTANIRFVHFDSTAQSFPSTTDHDTAQLLQPPPSRLVTPKAVRVAQIARTQSRLLGHHQPHDMKPQSQRFPAVLKNGAGRNRYLSRTTSAMEQSAIRTPSARTATPWTRKSFRPSHPFQIRRAVRVTLKPVEKLLEIARIRTFWSRFHAPHTTCGGHLSQSATQFIQSSVEPETERPIQARGACLSSYENERACRRPVGRQAERDPSVACSRCAG